MGSITVVKTAEDQASKALQVTVPVERVQAAETKAVRYYSTRARLPGFRPGKAPDAVVRKRFHDEIRRLVLQEVIRESWDVAKAPAGSWTVSVGANGPSGAAAKRPVGDEEVIVADTTAAGRAATPATCA